MPDLPKQELDELFREGAGMQQFEYNEAAWNKMEVMLDNDDKNRKIGIWLLLLVGTAFAIMAGLYYSSLEGQTTPQEVIYANEDISSSNSSLENKVAQTEVAKEEVTKAIEEVVVEKETISTDNVAVANEIKTASNLIITNTAKNSIASFEEIHSDNNVITSSNRTTRSKDNISFTNGTNLISAIEIVNDQLSSKTISEKNQENAKSEVIRKGLIEISALQNRNSGLIATSNNDVENGQSKVAVALAEYDSNNASLASKLSFTVFVAPEWSSLGVGGPKEMGYKFGAKLGFQLSDKFELGTGLFLSQKKFNGNGSQFTISEGWVDDIMPMTMEAKCNVIEIPLDLNYHFNGVGNTGFVAGIGLRSFMLHSEWYGFEYNASQYKPELKDEIITSNTQNKNWVGSIEISLGYTKKVSDNLAVQIVPYLQIPITGIGEGKVDLYSGGVQFAARFDGR